MEAVNYLRFAHRKLTRRDEALDDAKRMAALLDTAFRIPGTNIRFGWDAIIGLLPGVGDAATTIVGLSPLFSAWRLGASRWLLFRMLANLGVDATFGSIPILGTAFDIFYRANLRNARLLEKHLEARSKSIDVQAPNADVGE